MNQALTSHVSTAEQPFEEGVAYTQQKVYAGDVLYTENMPAHHMYVVKEGVVDIYMIREEKRVVVESLGKGQCFGVAPHLAKGRRVNNAAARTYCELYLIPNDVFEADMLRAPKLTRSLLKTFSDRLSTAHEIIATRVNYQSEVLVYAQLLHILGLADVGKAAVNPGRGGGTPAQVMASPLLSEVFVHARALLGHSDQHIRGCLAKLLTLHLIRIEDEKGNGKRVLFSPKDILSQARKITSNQDEPKKVDYEYISVDEFATMVEVDRSLLLRKLAGSEFADDVFTFRKTEVLRLLNDKGKRFFAERKIKTPEEFNDVLDLEFADQKSVFSAVSQQDTLDIAKLLKTVDSETVRQKILGALSRTKRQEVEHDMSTLTQVDPVEAQQIGASLVKTVRKLMLKQE
jgi:CRP-like cAMP-binding protein